MHFGPWELAAFGGLWIGAFMLAMDVGLRMSPNIRARVPKSERLQESGWWGFVPLILLTLSGTIFLADALGWLPTRQATIALTGAWQFIAPTVLLLLVLAIWILKRPLQHRASAAQRTPGVAGGDLIEELGEIDSKLGRQGKGVEAILSRLDATEHEIAEDKLIMNATVAALNVGIKELSDSIGQIRGQLSGVHDRSESDRKYTASIFRILSTSLRARDAEAIIKEADEVAMSVSKKLMTGGYPDEAAWTADYTIWRDAIGRIDGVVSSWQDHHTPYLAIGLKELEAGAPTPPPECNVTSSNGVMWYKTVWLVQQSYSNHRDGMRRYFHAKAGELPG